MGWYYYGFRPRASAAQCRRRRARDVARFREAGRDLAPVEIAGRKIATTFWGQAWCDNLEAYSDYSNRLPRGRTYVRNGSVIDLAIEAGRVCALVSGTDLYKVTIGIEPVPPPRWAEIRARCAGQIGSLVELLQGALSSGVMEIVTREGEGLFPSPREIALDCSCPDWATMCKHVAATLYGVGARLDREPELLFTLRGVDPTELVEAAVARPPAGDGPRGRSLEAEDLSSLFGVDIDTGGATAAGGGETGPKITPASTPLPKEAAPKSRAPRKQAPRKKIPKKKIPKKPAPKKAAPKKAAPRKKTPRKAAPRKQAPRKAAPRKAAPRKAAPKSRAPRKQAPRKQAPRKKAPRRQARLSAEALRSLHRRAEKLVEASVVLCQLIDRVQLARGRLYLFREDGLMARVTPVGPRSMLLETPSGRSWTEQRRGSLAAVLEHVERDTSGTFHWLGALLAGSS